MVAKLLDCAIYSAFSMIFDFLCRGHWWSVFKKKTHFHNAQKSLLSDEYSVTGQKNGISRGNQMKIYLVTPNRVATPRGGFSPDL